MATFLSILIPPASGIVEGIDTFTDEVWILGGGSSAALKPAIDGFTGFPFVYLYDGRTAMEITGFDALDIINDFVEE